MQHEGLRDSEWPKIYFGSKYKLYKKCTTGSSARAGSEARPGRERAAGRWRAAGSVNRTEHRSSGSLRPSASVHYGRTDTFFRLTPLSASEYVLVMPGSQCEQLYTA